MESMKSALALESYKCNVSNRGLDAVILQLMILLRGTCVSSR